MTTKPTALGADLLADIYDWGGAMVFGADFIVARALERQGFINEIAPRTFCTTAAGRRFLRKARR